MNCKIARLRSIKTSKIKSKYPDEEEHPQLLKGEIPEVNIEYIKNKLLKEHQTNSGEVIFNYRGYEVRLLNRYIRAEAVSNHKWKAVYVYSEEEEDIVFFSLFVARAEVLRGFPYKSPTQVLVWRNKYIDDIQGISYQVIDRYFLKKFHSLVSDKYQSKSGRLLWEIFTRGALFRGLEVYVINTKNKTSELITDEDRLEEVFQEIYSYSSESKYILLGVGDPRHKEEGATNPQSLLKCKNCSPIKGKTYVQ